MKRWLLLLLLLAAIPAWAEEAPPALTSIREASSLEEALHLNKYYVSHLFSQKLGISFHDYINSLRVSEACRLLLNTEKSITQISEGVGFNTLRTFNRAFTKQLGISPSQYRKASPSVMQTARHAGAASSSPNFQTSDRTEE